jgi:hypothetical protein
MLYSYIMSTYFAQATTSTTLRVVDNGVQIATQTASSSANASDVDPNTAFNNAINLSNSYAINYLSIPTNPALTYYVDTSNTSEASVQTRYYATSPYADVNVRVIDNGNKMLVEAKFKQLKGVSGIHIHVNNNGSPGPILVWLATTFAWQHGVMQNEQDTNSPCCTNQMCNVIAPEGTPYMRDIDLSKTYTYTAIKPANSSCAWVSGGIRLDVHGLDFQREVNGKLSPGEPGLDMIYDTPFIQI